MSLAQAAIRPRLPPGSLERAPCPAPSQALRGHLEASSRRSGDRLEGVAEVASDGNQRDPFGEQCRRAEVLQRPEGEPVFREAHTA